MASIMMNTMFPSKRRKTHSSLFVTDAEMTSACRLSSSGGGLASATSGGYASSSSHNHHGHRRQHSTGSNKGLPPPMPRASRRRESNNNYNSNLTVNVQPPVSPVPSTKMCTQSMSSLSQPDIRMVLIEAEQRVLYDTMTVIPTRHVPAQNGSSLSPCKEFQFLRRRRDTKRLSQLLFGAIPTTSSNESFKIHMLEDEKKILISKTFVIPKSGRDQNGSDSDSQSTLKSIDGWRSHFTQSTTSTPETFSRVRHISLTSMEDDDMMCEATATSSSMTLPARAFSPPHRLSMNRRRQMATKTSLSELSSYAIPSSIKSRSRFNSIGSQTDDEHSSTSSNHCINTVGASSMNSSTRNVAVGVIFSTSQRFFLFQHMPLIEAEMTRFESRIVTAASHPPTFLHSISYSWDEFTETICCLHNAPRLKNPIWLTLNEKPVDEKPMSKVFCDQLAHLVRKYDNKEKKYFISNVLTAVLMHHMSWVASVASAPARSDPPNANVKKLEPPIIVGMPPATDAQISGYNAQMAQYLEVLGSNGSHKSAKFVICGHDSEELAMICQVLSYFIRCAAVQHVDTEKCWDLPSEQTFSPVASSATPDSAASPLSSCHLTFSPPDRLFDDEDHLFEYGSHSKTKRARSSADNHVSPSSSIDSLPPVVVTQTTICVVETDETSIAVIDRLDYPCCHSSEEDEEEEVIELWSPRLTSDGLGRSLFAGPLPMYCHHFVVSGLIKNSADMGLTLSKMYDEVRCNDSPSHRAVVACGVEDAILNILNGTAPTNPPPAITTSVSSSSVGADSPMPENVLVVADVEDLKVKIISSDGFDEIASPSEVVVAMLEEFMKMTEYNIEPRSMMAMFEDTLSAVVSKSISLVEIVAGEGKASHLAPDRVCKILGCDYSDLRLIVNVAAVYWPPVLTSFGPTPLPYH